MADAPRDRIAAYLADAFSGAKAENADAILAIVREVATSDPAVEAAATSALNSVGARKGMPPVVNALDMLDSRSRAKMIEDMRAAILAALGGNDG